MAPNKEQAKRVLLEIIRQAGGTIGKTNLFNAFWIAHLYYSKTARGYLTDWPIVRLPNGPGIDRADELVRELLASGSITSHHVPCGPFTEMNYQLASQAIGEDLSGEAIQAIQAALKDVQQHRHNGGLSAWSQDVSRSWKTTPNGLELDIYSDLIPDDVYEERQRQLVQMKKDLEDLFA
jgi:hypothetical protein